MKKMLCRGRVHDLHGYADATTGVWTFMVPREDYGFVKQKGQVIISTPGRKDVRTNLAAIFIPGQNVVATASNITVGSSLAAGGTTFAVIGSFTTIDNNVDYNQASSTYGDVSGEVPASQFQLTGTSSIGTFDLMLSNDEPFMLSLLPAWNSPDPFNPNPVSFSVPMTGIATFNGIVTHSVGLETAI
ncbi:MAG: hypothetical protein JO320_01365 [Alphaproteobacteria bacterium]|nr:hypothetical protein [Alphaproteobacteria bacterium]